MGGWGQVLPLQKGGGAGKILAILNGGTTSFRVVLTWVLEVLTILKLMGGGQKVSAL